MEISLDGSEYADYLVDELMQAARRRFYRPEYIADHYSYSDTVNLNDSIVFYTYTHDDDDREYTIEESIKKDGWLPKSFKIR